MKIAQVRRYAMCLPETVEAPRGFRKQAMPQEFCLLTALD